MGYPGGKGGAGVAQTIINQLPPHKIYIEAFAGSAAVYRYKRPAAQSFLIEKDESQAAQLEAFADDSTEVINDCALSQLEALVIDQDTLIYCDPPYLRETRTRDIYRHEMTDMDHFLLLQILKSLPSAVVISGYPSAVYDKALDGWRKYEFQAMTRGGVRTECLWMNYPEPTELHDYRYLGDDRTDRQRIRRKVARWKAKLSALPALERQAILFELAGADKSSHAGSREAVSVYTRGMEAAE